MNKKQFAEQQIAKFLEEEGFPMFEEHLIQLSSTVAVCAEYLGFLRQQKYQDYAASRGGIHDIIKLPNGEVSVVSVREYMLALPD